MLVSYRGFFRILRQADSRMVPGSAGKEVESETEKGRKPVRNECIIKQVTIGETGAQSCS